MPRALVLTRDHRCLQIDGAVPEIDSAERFQVALARSLAARGLELPSICGSMPGDGGQRDLAYVVDAPVEVEGGRWIAVSELGGWAWSGYVDMMLGGWEPPAPPFEVFAFGSGPEMESRLAHLVICGAKRGTATWIRALEHDGGESPTIGSISIVVDGFGMPRCAIRTDSVERLLFGEVTDEMAAIEGEGDLSLADWRRGHLRFWRAEAAELGLEFEGDSEPITFERFSVLQVIGRADPVRGG
jgi:uncharacterized protein YhfF